MSAYKKVYTSVIVEKFPRPDHTAIVLPNEIRGGKIRKTPTNDYLKYYRPLRKYYQMKYKLVPQDFDMLFFLYSEKYFTCENFEEFDNILAWDKGRLDNMVRDGWVNAFDMKRSDHKKVYELSYKGKHLCNAFYNVLNGKEIPMGRSLNPLQGLNGQKKRGLGFSQKVLRLFIIDINKAYRGKKRTGIDNLPYD